MFSFVMVDDLPDPHHEKDDGEKVLKNMFFSFFFFLFYSFGSWIVISLYLPGSWTNLWAIWQKKKKKKKLLQECPIDETMEPVKKNTFFLCLFISYYVCCFSLFFFSTVPLTFLLPSPLPYPSFILPYFSFTSSLPLPLPLPYLNLILPLPFVCEEGVEIFKYFLGGFSNKKSIDEKKNSHY